MYKNIIFDVGEVLLTYDWRFCLEKAGVQYDEAIELWEMLFTMDRWAEFDLGVRSYWDVVEDICSEIPKYEKELRVFFSNMDDMPIDRPKVWEEIKGLKENGYKLYVLSNYSEIMFQAHSKGKPFMDYMDGAIFSYMVHINKPDEGIYKALLDKYSLMPAECVFFDDREANTEAARKLGIDSITITDEASLIKELRFLREN